MIHNISEHNKSPTHQYVNICKMLFCYKSVFIPMECELFKKQLTKAA